MKYKSCIDSLDLPEVEPDLDEVIDQHVAEEIFFNNILENEEYVLEYVQDYLDE